MKKIINNFKNWNPSKLVIILILLFPLCYYLIEEFQLDNDFWFLVNTGKNILQEGFIHVEPFTIHTGLAYIPQQWLTCVLFYFIFHYFGMRGMFFFLVSCYIIITIICYKLAYMVSSSKKNSMLITLLFNCMAIKIVMVTRPQTLDLIFFLAELYILELYIKKGNKKALYFLPLLSLIIINFHASMWMMFFVFLAPYYAEYIISKWKKEETFEIKPLIISSVLSLMIGFINPYGIGTMTYLFRSYGIENINNYVSEMQPFYVKGYASVIVLFILCLVVFSFYYNKGQNKVRYFLLATGTMYLFITHSKGLPFFIVTFPLVLGYNFKDDRKLKNRQMFKIEKIIYSVIIVTLFILTLITTKMDDDEVLKEIANYLDKNATTSVKLYTNYEDGSYMEYKGYKCYIDPRAEIFLKSNNKKKDIFDEYYNLYYGKLDAKGFLENYNFDYLLVDKREIYLLNELKNNQNYQEVYSHKIEKDKKSKTTKYLYKRIK